MKINSIYLELKADLMTIGSPSTQVTELLMPSAYCTGLLPPRLTWETHKSKNLQSMTNPSDNIRDGYRWITQTLNSIREYN